MIDVHLHTKFSPDSGEAAENYIKEALLRGDKIIGFSDHCEYNMREFEPDFFVFDPKEYFAEIARLQTAYPQIKILKGVEFGYSEYALPQYKNLLKNYKSDFVIMSVHTLPRMGECYYLQFSNPHTKRDLYAMYLEEVLKSVCCDIDYNVVGHVGYVARYTKYKDNTLRYADFADIFDKILKTVIDRDAAIELNTSVGGIDGDFVTDISIIDRYISLGGRNISFGSDAHSVARYCDNSDAVKNFLLSRGINYTVVYSDGKKEKIFFG